MAKAATSEELKDAFTDHLEVTKTHVSRLEEVFELLGEKVQAKKCDAMEGITKEGESIIEDTEEGSSTRDVGLILAGQKVEHYEIASYGTLRTMAQVMNHPEAEQLLSATLEEEKNADSALTKIAKDFVNEPAKEERR